VEISRAHLIEACQQLEVVVPSLDRIGSTLADDADARAAALARFVEEWQVAHRLALARRLLSDALEAGLTTAEKEGLDTVLAQPIWEPSPPR
jgi:hypothetical protein